MLTTLNKSRNQGHQGIGIPVQNLQQLFCHLKIHALFLVHFHHFQAYYCNNVIHKSQTVLLTLVNNEYQLIFPAQLNISKERSRKTYRQLYEEYLVKCNSNTPVINFLVLYAFFILTFSLSTAFDRRIRMRTCIPHSIIFDSIGVTLRIIYNFNGISQSFIFAIFEQNIRGLQISMNNSGVMQINDSLYQLFSDVYLMADAECLSEEVDILLQRRVILFHEKVLQIVSFILAIVLNQIFFIFYC